MSESPTPATSPCGVPRALPWLLVVGLTGLFHPYWLDFEQARRAVLLLLAGVCLVVCGPLAQARGEGALRLLVLVLLGDGCYHWLASLFAGSEQLVAFQPLEWLYRVMHWAALLVLLRVGSRAREQFVRPVTWTLLATAAYGIAQRLGCGEWLGYGVASEPVSSLGNLNVAAEWTAVAAAVAASRTSHLSHVALGLAGCYLASNGSRAALIALPLALLVAAPLQGRARPWSALLLLVLGAATGSLLPAPATLLPNDQPATAATAARGWRTVEVRWEIVKSCGSLLAQAPLLGWGPGQFAVEYPRVRSAREIELSSFGRQFATEVREAHNDYLEMAVDAGLVGLLALLAALLGLCRTARQVGELAPLLVLLLLMAVRAPLLNAPAVVTALWLASKPLAVGPIHRGKAWIAGLGLLLLALPPLLAQFAAVPIARAAAQRVPSPKTALAQTTNLQPWEPRWHQLQAQSQRDANELAAAKTTAAKALSLRPYDPHLAALLAEILLRGAASDQAAQIAQHGLRSDPLDLQLRLALATAQSRLGQADRAVETLFAEGSLPIAQLESLLQQLADDAARLSLSHSELQLRYEQSLCTALQRLHASTSGQLDAAATAVRAMLSAGKRTTAAQRDLRPLAIAAAHALDLGDEPMARELGKQATQRQATLQDWQRTQLREVLQRLAALQEWATLAAH